MTRAVLVVAAALAAAQAHDPWAPLRPFLGKWQGTASGKPGKGVSTREYRFDLGGRFLVARNRSVYEPTPERPESETHEDLGIFSYDRALKKLVLRQFHLEGFVNEYVLDALSPDGKTLHFVTVRIENIPAGWRARESYRILSPDEIEETFWLAPPGGDFERYSRTLLQRVE